MTISPTYRAILLIQADTLRKAAAHFLSDEGRIFDQDHDCAIVAARLEERADEYEQEARA